MHTHHFYLLHRKTTHTNLFRTNSLAGAGLGLGWGWGWADWAGLGWLRWWSGLGRCWAGLAGAGAVLGWAGWAGPGLGLGCAGLLGLGWASAGLGLAWIWLRCRRWAKPGLGLGHTRLLVSGTPSVRAGSKDKLGLGWLGLGCLFLGPRPYGRGPKISWASAGLGWTACFWDPVRTGGVQR